MLKSSSTYWEGNAQAETLQRVYGISFPSKKLLDEWVCRRACRIRSLAQVELQEQAAQRCVAYHASLIAHANIFSPI